jgi:carboxyl-terminal processing protease
MIRDVNKLTLFLVSIFMVGTFLAFNTPTEKYFEITKNLDIFATLYKEINTYYVDDVDPNKLIKTGINAMLESLDPYTNYIPEDGLIPILC